MYTYIYVYIYMYIYIYVYIYMCACVYRSKFRSQTSDNMDSDEKQRWKESENRREEERSSKRESLETLCFPMICGSGGSKVGSLKRRVRSQLLARWDEKLHTVVVRSNISKSKCTKHLSSGTLLEVVMSKKCTPLWREAHFQVKMYKTPQLRSTFRSCDVEKVHAVVARSTFRSQHVKNTTCSDIFWKLWRRKSDRRCGAKHISKSTC